MKDLQTFNMKKKEKKNLYLDQKSHDILGMSVWVGVKSAMLLHYIHVYPIERDL